MDATEFNHEYAHHASFLERFALRLTEDSETARRLVEETLYRALSNCEYFEVGTNFKAWMLAIMRNSFVGAYRNRQRLPKATQASESCAHPPAADLRAAGLSISELEGMLARVDPLYAKPFMLYYCGYRYEEIAEVVQVPINMVRSRILRARKQLNAMIAEARA